MVYFNVFIRYLNEFIMHLNILEFISMYFNVFLNIVIGISPLYCHYNNFSMCIHLHICFLLSTMTSFSTCSTTTLFSLVPIDPFKLHVAHKSITYQFLLFTFIHYPTFHIVTSCAVHSGAQVFLRIFVTYLWDKSKASSPNHMVLVHEIKRASHMYYME
jgi:hypothetical protein